MIRFVDCDSTEADLITLLQNGDRLHSCILSTALHAVTRRRPGLADFWVIYNENERPVLALMRQDGDFFLCEGEPPDETAACETAEFLRFMGAACLCGRHTLLERLYERASLPVPRGSAVLCAGETKGAPDGRVVRVREHFRPVFELICEDYFNFSVADGYDNWLRANQIRARDGVCGLYAIYEGEQPIAVAAFSAASETCADIGSVVVRRDRRGQGLGRAMVLHMMALAAKGGREAIICCANPELEKYYNTMGFTAFDRWGVCGGEND